MWQLFASTPRHAFQFAGVAWGVGAGVDPEDDQACLVTDAAEADAYGQTEKALAVLERVLSLNSPDHQGVRFCWNDIRNGRPWKPMEADDEASAEAIR